MEDIKIDENVDKNKIAEAVLNKAFELLADWRNEVVFVLRPEDSTMPMTKDTPYFFGAVFVNKLDLSSTYCIMSRVYTPVDIMWILGSHIFELDVSADIGDMSESSTKKLIGSFVTKALNESIKSHDEMFDGELPSSTKPIFDYFE